MLWRRQTWLSAGAGAVASGRYHSFLSGMNETPGFRAPCDSILLGNAYHVLLQEIERDGEQHDVLHQERDVAGHCRKSGRGIPAVRHEGDDRDGRDEGRGRAGGTENSEPLVQNPASSRAPNVHSETPRNQLAPWWPNTGYSHQISGPLLMKGTSRSASYGHHFW